MEYKKAISTSDYVKLVTSLKMRSEYPSPINKFVFRGQSDSAYELIPGLGRINLHCFDETNLITFAQNRFPEVFRKEMNPIELLTILQHYGIPTRMLDLTENALVALFFSCYGNENKDGEVIIFRYHEDTAKNFPIVTAIADSYKNIKGDMYFLDLFFKDMIKQPYFAEMDVSYKNKNEQIDWVLQCCEKPMIIYSPYLTDRQRIQSGMYLLFANEIAGKENGSPYFRTAIKPLSKDDEMIEMIITIPADAKASIINELDLLGINRMNLFSDSIDIVNEEIKNKYLEKQRY